MLEIRVDDDVYGLDDETAAELIRRLTAATPTDDDESAAETVVDSLEAAIDSPEPVDVDDPGLAVIGVVLEAWAVETDGDVPPDVQELRYAIAARLG